MRPLKACAAAAVLAALWLGAGSSDILAQAGEASKIGVFDPARVFELSQIGKEMRSEIESLTKAKRGEVQRKEEEFRALQEMFRQQEPSLSEDRRSEREREMQQKGIELKRVRDDANRAVQAQVSDIEQTFQKKVLEVIETLGQQAGYSLILDRAAVAFVSPSVDITDLIVSRLNAAAQSASKAN